jgi:acyl-CoA dehydrogenase
MNFGYSDRVVALQSQLRRFMDEHIVPVDSTWHEVIGLGIYPPAMLEELKVKARAEALWNLFLPDLKEDEPGTRLTNLEYAPLAEMMGRIPWSSEVFNCSAPDTGNMELLHLFATPRQRRQWLTPLLEGRIRSCFAMTEPDVASSDATNIATTIRREGDDYVINGRKWFATGAADPRCRFVIVMGRMEGADEAGDHARHSMVIVPTDVEGFSVVRNVPIMHHHAPEGHCELLFENVRVGAHNLVGAEGAGFELAQARLGPGRIHHAMRTIGQCELALELMCERASRRVAFGRPLAEFANVGDWIAESRVEIDQARLLVLRAAWMLDTQGKRSARAEVSAIKLVTSRLQVRVLDRAIQVFGARGLTPDTPLSFLWTWGRALRFIDGPDEVHLRVLARRELKPYREKAFVAPQASAPKKRRSGRGSRAGQGDSEHAVPAAPQSHDAS